MFVFRAFLRSRAESIPSLFHFPATPTNTSALLPTDFPFALTASSFSPHFLVFSPSNSIENPPNKATTLVLSAGSDPHAHVDSRGLNAFRIRLLTPLHPQLRAAAQVMENGGMANVVCSEESINGSREVWSCNSDAFSADHLVIMVNGILGRSVVLTRNLFEIWARACGTLYCHFLSFEVLRRVRVSYCVLFGFIDVSILAPELKKYIYNFDSDGCFLLMAMWGSPIVWWLSILLLFFET